jgi:hypothetical protein
MVQTIVVCPNQHSVGGWLFIYLEGYIVPHIAFSSLYVVPDCPCICVSYLFPTCLPCSLLFLHMYSGVLHILLSVSDPGGECSSQSSICCRLSCLEVTRRLVKNGRNVLCIVGATQPMGILLPHPSHISTQLCGFHILPPVFNNKQLCGFGIFNALPLGPQNGSPPFPLLSPPPIIPIIVGMGGLPAPDVRRSTYLLAPYILP